MIFAGILAGGSGTRMEGTTIPKQFLRIKGVPIFVRTLKTFLSVQQIDKIIVSMNIDWKEEYEKLIHDFSLDSSRIVLVPGGDSRFTSMLNVVNKARELGDDESLIITHDCARVFVSRQIIEDNIDKVKKYDMVTTALPTIDTILYSEDGESSNCVPDRSKFWNDQGPQSFYIGKFLHYASMIPKSDYKYYIEAGKVYLSHGARIGIIKGDRYNFKITNDFDLKYAEFLLEGGYVE